MIKVEIESDGKGCDCCEISVEAEYLGDDALVHLFSQLSQVNNTILESFVKMGFSPEKVSRLIAVVLLHNITDFRKLHDLKA